VQRADEAVLSPADNLDDPAVEDLLAAASAFFDTGDDQVAVRRSRTPAGGR